MEVILKCCAGLDVHKKSIQACLRRIGGDGTVHKEIRPFGTMTRDILELGDWMAKHGVTHVAMESTGVFWKPIYNLLEDRFNLLLCNAKHIKQVPGRKTDVKDCEWIAQLLQHGLLSPSFVPPKPLRELRDLTRHRVKLTNEHTSVANRIHKTLEDANIKLSSVATDILGVSGREMIKGIIAGEEDPIKLAEMSRRRLRDKIPELQVALEGRVNEHHRFMLKALYEHLTFLERLIDQLTERIDKVISSEKLNSTCVGEDVLPFPAAVDLLSTIPGVDKNSAVSILAEIGTDMSRFPSADHLASWAGICPGNNESAGKRKSGKTPKGDRWLSRVLNQTAWAASRSKNTYLQAQYRRLSPRRGKKRAAVALSHTILVICYYMLKTNQRYVDLGPDHFDRLNLKRVTNYLVHRLESLGYAVTLEESQTAA